MRKIFRRSLILIVCISVLLPSAAYARKGDCGYEGGISSGEAPNKTSYEYQEPCFITGEPIIFKGTVTIKKSLKQDVISTTYTYNLRNAEKAATLTRTLVYNTKVANKDNGQRVEETLLTGRPTEVVRIGGNTYTMSDYSFTSSNLVDPKPAIEYYAGNIWGKKTYTFGAANSGNTVTVENTGSFYGYDEYWGSSEVQTLNYVIESSRINNGSPDRWGGTASVKLSMSTSKQLKYVENEPDQISFSGGYVQSQKNNGILEYSATLPEFDSKGVSTDSMVTKSGSLALETFPVLKSLITPYIPEIRGHWAENDINMLYGLEVLSNSGSSFNPDQYMTRVEFASMFLQAAREVPVDPALVPKTTTRPTATKNNPQPVSPFIDVETDSQYFTQVNDIFKRGLMSGRGNAMFVPEGQITLAETLTAFIRALGLESLGPGESAVTTFRDNDEIPDYARNAAYVAEKIGLIQGDELGYLRPNEILTRAKGAVLINTFIKYMSEGITKDYRDRIVNF